MQKAATNTVIDKVRLALGRTAPLAAPPVPPVIDEPTARLVYSAIGLPELFMKRATDMKMLVENVRVEEVLDRTAAFLQEKKCTKVMLSDTNLLLKLGAAEHLGEAGLKSGFLRFDGPPPRGARPPKGCPTWPRTSI